MPQQVTMYRAADGSLHQSEREALQMDLRLLFVSSGAVNECSAGALVAWIAESPEQVAELVKGLKRVMDRVDGLVTCPTCGYANSPLAALNGTKP